MPLRLVPILKVQQAFVQWKKVRCELKRIRNRIQSQDAILTPSEAIIPPETFAKYQSLVVNAYQTEFCRQILNCNDRHKERVLYNVSTYWDIDDKNPMDAVQPYECNVLWDRVVLVPRLGFAQCLMLSNVLRLRVSTIPVPVDYIEGVKAWVVQTGD